MSPGVADPDALFKLMACAVKGCAIRGWALKRENPILERLWKKIMGASLEDRPQTIFYKINLLFSLKIFPDIYFDPVSWHQKVALEDEVASQLAFFKKTSSRPEADLLVLIRDILEPLSKNGTLLKQQQSLTATAVWTL